MPLTTETANSVAIILGAVGTFIVSVGTFVMQWRANRKMNEMRESGARRLEQITAVHDIVAKQIPPKQEENGQGSLDDNSGR